MKDLIKYSIFTGLFSVLFLPVIVVNSMLFYDVVGKAFFFRIIVEIIFGLWLILIVQYKEFRPKFSSLVAAIAVFCGVMLLADLLAVFPARALWGNYERMEGFVMLAHVFAYFVVMASMFRGEAMWRWFLRLSLALSSIVACVGVQEMLHTGQPRVSSTLGNPLYVFLCLCAHVERCH